MLSLSKHGGRTYATRFCDSWHYGNPELVPRLVHDVLWNARCRNDINGVVP